MVVSGEAFMCRQGVIPIARKEGRVLNGQVLPLPEQAVDSDNYESLCLQILARMKQYKIKENNKPLNE